MSLANDPVLDAWLGMRNMYKNYQNLYLDRSITREDYEEYGNGPQLFKTNPFSNVILKYQP